MLAQQFPTFTSQKPQKTQAWVVITPDIAKAYLECMDKNRPFRHATYMKYRRMMEQGSWAENGETIKFCWNGHLIDGQHRLRAIIATGLSQEILVVRGLDPKAFDTIDAPKVRSLQDCLHIRGEVNVSSLSIAAKLQWRHEHDLWTTGGAGMNQLSTREVEELIDTHEGLRDAVRATHSIRNAGVMTHGTAAFLWYQFALRSPEQTMEFFEKLRTGANLDAGDPVLTLRNKITLRPGGTVIYRIFIIAYAIKAWNAIRQGHSLSRLTWRHNEKTSHEPMPTIMWPKGQMVKTSTRVGAFTMTPTMST